MTEFDVVIVGAGLSGIGAAVRLAQDCPDRTYTVLESRAAIGGTWDLFRYPGIRSDSDAYTMSYGFEPWASRQAIADGGDIRTYIQTAADKFGVSRHVRFGTCVRSASWSSQTARWTVHTEVDGAPQTLTCRFLHLCTGYYSYERGYQPEFPGLADFTGPVIHPQHWPADLDVTGKRVVVIGSGATAVTLVPALAKSAAHVTMLQRSPSYVLAMPEVDHIAQLLRKVLPAGVAHTIVRAKNMALLQGIYELSRRRPELAKRLCRKVVLSYLKDPAYVDKHFAPRYEPWDQRLCLVPDGDLFRAIRDGSASVVTDSINRFLPQGIELTSGQILDADVVVSATGLRLLPLGGTKFEVDGAPVDLADTVAYRAVMLSGVPNLSFCFGYTNNSWTLRADLSSRYLCRLLNHMRTHGQDVATPVLPAGVQRVPFLDLTSGYVQRGIADFPKAGTTGAWVVSQNHLKVSRAFGRLDLTEDMIFSACHRAPAEV
ncbi:MAG TPA: NAD(P)/FAD-dependent oxidoreductase [Sporichthyaceae bacterium]|jgi:cation diffusion facilitator CzcD-associated flavoprotein CzcO|nr:NAD(P)/FAD-dependent oxidoreductase [Sporichthyaceae bacterium]